MRPQSIVWFERLYLASVCLGILTLALNYDLIEMRAVATGGAGTSAWVGAVIGVCINLLFWFFIARRASNIAKWILVVMTAVGIVGMIAMLSTLLMYGPLYTALTGAVTLLQLVAMVFLFRRDAVDWLKSGGRNGPIDLATFE